MEGHTNACVEAGLSDGVKILILTIFGFNTGKSFDPEDPTHLNSKRREMYCFNKPEKLLPPLEYTQDDTGMLTDILTTIPDFVKQTIAEFSTGTRDIETRWDQYLAELDSIGLAAADRSRSGDL